jgi:hypothetical protein
MADACLRVSALGSPLKSFWVTACFSFNFMRLDPLSPRDDLVRLLIETGTSSTRPKDAQFVDEDGHTRAGVTITRRDGIIAAARVT